MAYLGEVEHMRNTILIVDDIEVNRAIIKEIFKNEYNVAEAENGEEAVKYLKEEEHPAAILLDIVMPVMNGFEVLTYARKAGIMEGTPVVLLTGEGSTENKKRAYDMGVNDFIEKPFDSYVVRSRVNNLIDLYRHRNNLQQLVDEQTRQIKEQAERISDMNYRIIDTLGTIVEFRNLESGTHIYRVREFTRVLLEYFAVHEKEYGLDAEKIRMISYASAMHDVGKIAIPDSILLKPGRLTPEEFEIMKQHTVKGYEIIRHITALDSEEYLKYCRDIAKSHHERYDGKGYPEGLVGEEIPIEAQIVSMADVYDALVSDRIYRSAIDTETAYQMIRNGECGSFSPKLMFALEKVKPEYERIVKSR